MSIGYFYKQVIERKRRELVIIFNYFEKEILTNVEDDFQLFGEYFDNLLSGSAKKYSSSATKYVL